MTLEILTVSHFFLRENYSNKTLEAKDVRTLPLKEIFVVLIVLQL